MQEELIGQPPQPTPAKTIQGGVIVLLETIRRALVLHVTGGGCTPCPLLVVMPASLGFQSFGFRVCPGVVFLGQSTLLWSW